MVNNRPKILLVVRAVIVDGGKVLLIKRSGDDRWEPGRWEIPGGKLDSGQSVLEVAQREVKEEAGLVIKVGRSEIFTFSDKKAIETGKYKGYYYLTLIFKTSNFSGKLRLGPEHEDSKWVTLENAFKLKLTGETWKILKFLTER